MIKLERRYTPIKLTPTFVALKTDEFKREKKSVWNITWLKEALLDLSYKKCAYCECYLLEESKYMEVEHFEDKDTYKDKVLIWDNLLPSCKRCNVHKGAHDVNSLAIINPFINAPKNYLYFNVYRLKAKNSIGRISIDLLDLNSTERLVEARFKIGNGLQKIIDTALESLVVYESVPTALHKTKLFSKIRGILLECQKEKEYAATCATVLHTDGDYIVIRQKLIDLSLWDDELEQLHRNSLELILVE